jgi:uncharacterized membrane protein HdeD (DUF308 family)
MLSFIGKLWWTVALRGLLLLIFGIIAVTAPLMPPETLISYLGFIFVGLGVIVLIASITLCKSISYWFLQLLFSLFDLALGLAIIFNTSTSAKYFSAIIAVWALLMGLSQFMLAIKPSALKIFLLINGTLSVAFAFIIYFNPFAGNNTMNFMVGFYTILFSFFLIYIGFKMRTLGIVKAETKPEVEGNRNNNPV